MFTPPQMLSGGPHARESPDGQAPSLHHSFHQPPTKRSQLPASPEGNHTAGRGKAGGGHRPHRDIPSACRQLAPFRCQGVSPRLSASHSPSTSSGQQLLKPEKGRKWKPGASRLSVSATGQPAQAGTWKGPQEERARKATHREFEGSVVEAGQDGQHGAPAILRAALSHVRLCTCSWAPLTHVPKSEMGLVLSYPDSTPCLSCSSPRLFRVWKQLRDLGNMDRRRQYREKA